MTYAKKDKGSTSYYLMGSSAGDSGYLPLRDCVLPNSAEGQSLLGYGCGESSYRVRGWELQRTSFKVAPAHPIAHLICKARVAGKIVSPVVPSPHTTWSGVVKPSFMAIMTKQLAKKGADNYAYPMRVPDKGKVDMVTLPIPFILTPYEEGLMRYAYSEADIRLHRKTYQKAIRQFLNRWDIEEVYVGLPFEGTSPYIDPEDREQLFTEEDYESYDPVKSLRVMSVTHWHPNGRFSRLDSGDMAFMYRVIKERKVDFHWV